MTAATPRSDSCHRGHAMTPYNTHSRQKRVNGVVYEERTCRECCRLRFHFRAAELDRIFRAERDEA